jgi:ATP-dependent DNA ligase
MVYDLLQVGDKDYRNLGNATRLYDLHEVVSRMNAKFVHDLPIITADFGAFFDTIIAKGGEGIILKDRLAPYKEDARPTYWLKVKKEETHDCFILGIDKGNGKYAGLFGALVVGQIIGGKVEVVAKVSGMTDEIRLQLYRTIMGLPDAKAPLKIKDAIKQVDPNMVIEVECMERLKSGFMRHPRFLRFRDDKTWQQCIME